MNAVEQAIAEVLPDVFSEGAVQEPRDGVVGNVIPEGQRDHTLASMAGAMRRKGFPAEAITVALNVVNRQSCRPPLPDRDIERIACSVGRYQPSGADKIPTVKAFTLAQLERHVFPDRPAILLRCGTPVIRAGNIVQVNAERGRGKTFYLQTLALVAASDASALGFSSPGACRVTYIDGEMGSEEIKERFALLRGRLDVSADAPITIVGADWQEEFLPRIDTEIGQEAIEPYVADADVVFFDNRSCLFSPDGESDPAAWQPAQDYLLSLRRRGKAVIIAHHSNRQGGARGHSKPEDLMDVLMSLTKPEDYRQEQGARFVVTFTKSRGVYGPAVAEFLAHLTPAGWVMESADFHQEVSVKDKLIEYVTLAHEAGDRPRSANAAVRGARVNRSAGLRAWAELTKSQKLRQHSEDGWFYVP